MTLSPTPSQTAGPYVEIGAGWSSDGHLVPPATAGAITLTGTVLDGTGEPVTDAVLEFFQADPAGRYAPEAGGEWSGFARSLTVDAGRYSVTTLKPGRVAIAGATEAPHVSISLFARGLLQRAVTYVYFDDEPEANAADPFFSRLGSRRQERLLARSEPGGYCFDIVLRGEEETPFFVP